MRWRAAGDRGRYALHGLRVFAVVVAWLLAVLNLYFFRIADPDFWVHVRCGADILASGQILQVDTYSFTAAGLPVINHEWGAEVLLAWFFAQGVGALIGLKMALGIAFLVVFWRLIRMHAAALEIVLPLLVFGAHIIGRSLLFRPQIVTYLFLALTFYVLERQRHASTRWLWTLPPLFCVWANMHGGFPVGLALIGYYWLLLSREPRRLALGAVFGLSCLATLINPYGLTLWTRIVQTVLDPVGRQYIQEWQPVWVALGSWDNRLVLGVAATALASALLCRKPTWGDVLLVLGFVALGCSSTRHLPLMAIMVLPLCGKWLGTVAVGWKRTIALVSLTGLVALPAVLTARFALADMRPRISVVDSHYRGFPGNAVEFLRAQPVGGNVWNELAWGGYMIWTLSPQWKVSLDGRNVNVYPPSVVRDHLELFASPTPDLSVLDRYPIDVCLFARERKLTQAMQASSRWKLIYQDEKAVVFANRESPLAKVPP